MAKPTLLSINNYHYRRGGAEVVFLEQMNLFADAGWKTVPFCMHHPENLASSWSTFFVEEIEFATEYSLLEKVRRVPKVIYSREAQRNLRRLIEKTRPDVSLLHNIYHHLSPAVLSVLKDMGVPSLLTLHDLKLACPAYKMLASDGICERCKGGKLSNVMRHRCIQDSLILSGIVYAEAQLHRLLNSYDQCDVLISPSHFVQQKLIEWGWAEDKFAYVPNFIDAELFQVRKHVEDYFVFFGRLAPEKGLVTLIKAANKAQVALKLIGTGPDIEELKRLTEDLQADVEFCGFQTGSDLYEMVGAARAVVLPSEWYENAPISILEAYALGVPVIGADIGGIPEMIVTGETGHTFPSGDVESLAAMLRDYADKDSATLLEMGAQARAVVVEKYDKQRHLAHLAELFEPLQIPVSGLSSR